MFIILYIIKIGDEAVKKLGYLEIVHRIMTQNEEKFVRIFSKKACKRKASSV